MGLASIILQLNLSSYIASVYTIYICTKTIGWWYDRLFPHAFLCWQARAWMSLISQTPICRPLAMPVSSEHLCQGKVSKWRRTVRRWRSEKLAAAKNKTLGPWHVLPVLWHWATTTGQPLALTTLPIYYKSGAECSRCTPSSHFDSSCIYWLADVCAS